MWGAGIRGPLPSKKKLVESNDPLSLEQYSFLNVNPEDDVEVKSSPPSWRLDHIRRVDIQQADLAPLMSTLIGNPFPVNSVGILPTDFLSESDKFKAMSLVTNAKQLFAQVQRQYQRKRENSFFFKEYKLLSEKHGTSELSELELSLGKSQFKFVQHRAKQLIELSIEALSYVQTYDRPVIITVMVSAYIGWLLFIFLLIIRRFTPFSYLFLGDQTHSTYQNSRSRSTSLSSTPSPSPSPSPFSPTNSLSSVLWYYMLVYVGLSVVLVLESTPWQYFVYLFFLWFFWTYIFHFRRVFYVLANRINQIPNSSRLSKVLVPILLTFILSEIQVNYISFHHF